jgi:uncharacterized protein (TIGR02588 family)
VSDEGGRRHPAEWVAFGIASALLALVVGAILAFVATGPARPPRFTVSAPQTRVADGAFHIRTEVRNTGEETAESVQVAAELVRDGETVAEGDQVIDFLPGGETREVEFVFSADPSSGLLDVRVTGYVVP